MILSGIFHLALTCQVHFIVSWGLWKPPLSSSVCRGSWGTSTSMADWFLIRMKVHRHTCFMTVRMDTEITGPWICPLAQKHFSNCLGEVPPTFLPGCINSRGRFWWRVTPEMYMGLQKASTKMYVLICNRTECWMGCWSLPSTDYSQVDDHVGRPGQSGQSGIRQRIDLGEGVTSGDRDSFSGQRN